LWIVCHLFVDNSVPTGCLMDTPFLSKRIINGLELLAHGEDSSINCVSFTSQGYTNQTSLELNHYDRNCSYKICKFRSFYLKTII
jgi:hypothetical protein